MHRFVLFGNSGSGKSTLAKRLARVYGIAHLDMDPLAWEPVTPPRRRAVAESARVIASFMDANAKWVVEGGYADLLDGPLARCTRVLFLNPGVDACVENAGARPWEPHKYATKEAQDANLAMLVDWIREYATRTDAFSLEAHRALFAAFAGDKAELTSLEEIAAFV